MNDPNITMEEYIRLEEEKAQSRGMTFNWQTATFGRMEHYYEKECFTNFEEEFPAIVFEKINGDSFDTEQGGMIKKYDDEEGDFVTEFPAIVFSNTFTTPPYEPTVNPSNESKLDFRISCDESDDEDYTVIFDENSFSYKIISVNDLKTVLENNDNNVTPTIDYDLNYFVNEFPAIVYIDGLTPKSDHGIKPIVRSENIDEFDLIDETSLSEYEEEIISRFNDLFNDIHSNDSKSEIDDDVQSSEDNENARGENGVPEINHDEIIETFETGSLVTNLNIIIYYYGIGMLIFLIMNLYLPFGIPFDPKRYYKDGSHTKVAKTK
ncbi:hypothetical protein Tco_0865587, partial [Tanacetum coccineum]